MSDQASYYPGQTITLTLLGSSGGAQDNTLFAAIVLDPTVLVNPQVQRFMPPPQAGKVDWLMGSTGPGAAVCPYQLNRCMLLNSIYPEFPAPGGPIPMAGVDPQYEPFAYGVLTATAGAPGVHQIDFVVTPTTQRVDFFGLTSAPSITITIVPEPDAAGLLVFGLAGLTLARWHVRTRRCGSLSRSR